MRFFRNFRIPICEIDVARSIETYSDRKRKIQETRVGVAE